MDTPEKTVITIETTVKATIDKVWECFTQPQHITQWNFAHESWECTSAENDLKIGGKFSYNMAARDGSIAFDFWGIYDEITPQKFISSTLGDGRKISVRFANKGTEVFITESFEAESQNPIEMQRGGWQAILDNFKKYTESKS